MQLSKNFTLAELTESQSGRRYNVKEQFNPPQQVINNLKELCEKVLQPIRDKVGAIKVSSGYRSPQVNKIVGGATSSQHLTGEAVDISGVNVSNKVLFDIIIKMMNENNLPVDQCIHEYGTKSNPAWVHVSYTSDRKPRRQVLYIGI